MADRGCIDDDSGTATPDMPLATSASVVMVAEALGQLLHLRRVNKFIMFADLQCISKNHADHGNSNDSSSSSSSRSNNNNDTEISSNNNIDSRVDNIESGSVELIFKGGIHIPFKLKLGDIVHAQVHTTFHYIYQSAMDYTIYYDFIHMY